MRHKNHITAKRLIDGSYLLCSTGAKLTDKEFARLQELQNCKAVVFIEPGSKPLPGSTHVDFNKSL